MLRAFTYRVVDNDERRSRPPHVRSIADAFQHSDLGRTHLIMSCRMGSTEHHVFFALLNLALLYCFLHFGQHCSGLRRGLIGGRAVLTVAYHAMLGGMCHSPAISEALHAGLSRSIYRP